MILLRDIRAGGGVRRGAAQRPGGASFDALPLSMRYLFRCATSSDALPLPMRYLFRCATSFWRHLPCDPVFLKVLPLTLPLTLP